LRAIIGTALIRKTTLPEHRTLETENVTVWADVPRATFDHDGAGDVGAIEYGEGHAREAQWRHRRVILMGRNVYDTVVSAYFHCTRRVNTYVGPIADFVRCERFGAIPILRFYNDWYRNRQVPKDFQYITYEDLHQEPLATVRLALDFMGAHHITDDEITHAIEVCEFDKLKKAEQNDKYQISILRATDKGDPETYKVRRGTIGGYVDYLSPDDIQYIDEIVKQYACPYTQFSKSDEQAP